MPSHNSPDTRQGQVNDTMEDKMENVKDWKEAIRKNVNNGEIDEDILIELKDCTTEEEIEALLERYT